MFDDILIWVLLVDFVLLSVLIPYAIWQVIKDHRDEQEEFARLLWAAEELGKLKAEHNIKEADEDSAEVTG